MTLILWTGKNGELLFNHRRCSRDRAVIADIFSTYAPAQLCVSPYSSPLFPGARIIHQLSEVGEDVLFLEDLPLLPALETAKTVIVYRFDRIYPADVKLQLPADYVLTQCRCFSGHSHETISREVYER